ncbi:heme utilization cystosolic carrier protein HutX [Neptuniibacter pectenicola]|jgi:putative heme utilization carrier protein HutX|uniref:heme utilization cystosolic carrier protein HutX n=1 Tax=Neptuniibacter pectenicola TaxID=1806669 RepID=UPI00079927DB|nr:heme utilization cystosolic carrier protein HutX [Neptuniibacter pectenicola]KXJ53650.1 MAG: heme iron utilization protein [Neptuniibacter sp. Phe_28]|tara:strand:+ start:2460 stop:2861 length:402 start_codon:yes stop_codon:yes gene_type:complete
MNREDGSNLPGDLAEALLSELATWGNTTTIILHGGSVFEFKGPFPKGEIGHGYYNLTGPIPGFHGHINLNGIHHINFQDKPHRGQASYAFNFQDQDDNNIFKVFLGRNEDGTLIADQVSRFKHIQQQLSLKNL